MKGFVLTFLAKNYNTTATPEISGLVLCFFVVEMEEFVRIMEQPSSTTEPTNHYASFFKTKVNIWDYAKISGDNFQKLSFNDRASILKNYYSDIAAK